ncbi:hypothetical protein LZ30DRAFT_466942 [Colletotrichum cereale]|nr:hypothetical protein LZ30DRAFT_466942 [Colletotrichum cereale]
MSVLNARGAPEVPPSRREEDEVGERKRGDEGCKARLQGIVVGRGRLTVLLWRRCFDLVWSSRVSCLRVVSPARVCSRSSNPAVDHGHSKQRLAAVDDQGCMGGGSRSSLCTAPPLLSLLPPSLLFCLSTSSASSSRFLHARPAVLVGLSCEASREPAAFQKPLATPARVCAFCVVVPKPGDR